MVLVERAPRSQVARRGRQAGAELSRPRFGTISRDGRTLYLTTGSDPVSRNEFQLGRLYLIDLDAAAAIDHVELERYGIGHPVLYEP